MLKKIKQYVKNRKALKEKCLRFRKHIKKGHYLLTVNKRSFTFRRVTFAKAVMNFKLSYFFKGEGDCSLFTLISGTEKINFITDTVVVSKFFNSDTPIELIQNRIKLYLPKLLLPHSDYLSFDVEKKEFLSSYVSGDSFTDEEHSTKLMDALVKNALISDIVKIGKDKNCLLFVQHGDAYGNNVIWQDDNNFKCIDNENVGLYPAFYDAFLLASINSANVDDFLHFNKRYLSSYKSFCKKNGVTFSGFLDKYISYFIFFRMMSYSSDQRGFCHRPFVFMNDEKFKDNFPKSYEVLQAFYRGINIPEYELLYKESTYKYE